MTKRSDTPLEWLPMPETIDPEKYHPVAVWRAAIGLFEGAERWLHQEVMGLGGERPVDVMRADLQQVLDLIGKIEHGVHT
ncbi:MbcA/ParS/Xre antitoxin family protein [Marinobacter sp. TBZ242]|uniref:MbcA/ParS/Xre antitoxin family protein n=1 Tax=Marinobacter azerbaijanicus TaxID=3050455 RepID=A0ABT7IJ79_9GAMM|nr:MbcA/ParS/Xre antitoxin family protein [Marinobacter sp. TBZ242]MDL0433755.1 MbcA/ParS/Xre antitoxin family protein [Marinobacter sp. TBZ242]